MAASATFALNAELCVRRARLAIVTPDLRHSRRLQAETPLIDLSEFGQPALLVRNHALGHLKTDLGSLPTDGESFENVLYAWNAETPQSLHSGTLWSKLSRSRCSSSPANTASVPISAVWTGNSGRLAAASSRNLPLMPFPADT